MPTLSQSYSLLLNPSLSSDNTIRISSAGVIGLTVRGASGQTANLQEWQSSAGAINASISAAGALTCGNISSQGTIGIQLANTAFLFWSGRAQLQSPANGQITLFNNAANDFSLLQFGGTTSSFPAIKRNAAAINFRLADDSGDCSITAQNGAFVTLGVTSGTSTLNQVQIAPQNGYYWNGRSAWFSPADGTVQLQNNASTLSANLTVKANNNWQYGLADAAAPVAQILSVQSVVTGTSNTAGTNFTITGSQGTGTGVGGSLIFQVAPAGLTGSTPNTLATALTIDSTKLATFTGVISVPLGTGTITSINFGTANTGLYSTGTNVINIAVGGNNGAELAVTSFTLAPTAFGGTYTFGLGTGGGGNSNRAGETFTIRAGQSTGNQAGGDFNFQVTLPGISGTQVNPYTTTLNISGTTGTTTFNYPVVISETNRPSADRFTTAFAILQGII